MTATKPTPAAIRKALIAADNETRARILKEVIQSISHDDAVALAIIARGATVAKGSLPLSPKKAA